MPPLPKTIDEVLETLEHIIEETVSDRNYLGIFAYVYHRTTAQIKQAILDEEFDDNPGMEQFDVIFANLYIKAYSDFRQGKKSTGAWDVSFIAKDDPLIIMQHLMLGMNAHINMDLGIAAATFAPGEQIHGIKNDFMKVNQILQELIQEMKDRLSKVSKLMFLLEWFGNDKDEIFVGFSIKKSRDFAWRIAESIAISPDDASRQIVIQETDHFVTSIGKIVHHPPGKKFTAWLLKFVKRFEEKDVGTILKKLGES